MELMAAFPQNVGVKNLDRGCAGMAISSSDPVRMLRFYLSRLMGGARPPIANVAASFYLAVEAHIPSHNRRYCVLSDQ